MACPMPGHEEAALLRAVREGDPCDDVVRQVYADFLTDHGRAAHAHLVRHQKDHDDPFVASPEPAPDTPAAREAAAFAREALGDWVGPVPFEVNVQFRRGLLHAVMPIGAYLSGAYGDGLRRCRRAGWVETIELIDATWLPDDEVVAALGRRLEALAGASAECRRLIEQAGSDGVHPLYLVEEEYRLAVLEAESRFVESLSSRITDPHSGWAAAWSQPSTREGS